MTSLIFGAVYLTHQAVTQHRHEKKRVKNYERWEGLRDEYDEQRKVQRASRSLDIQRTGQPPWDDTDQPILTLRDQQEANDARTSWRPQEAWNDEPVAARPAQRQSMDLGSLDHGNNFNAPAQPRSQEHRALSLASGYNAKNASTPSLAPQATGFHGVGPMRPTPTGSAWDDGLPRPLAVQRRNFEDGPASSRGVSRSTSLRQTSSAASSSHNLASMNTTPPAQEASVSNGAANLNNPFEQGNRFDAQAQAQASPPQAQQQAFEPSSNNPFEQPGRFDAPLPLPPSQLPSQLTSQPTAFHTTAGALPPGNNQFGTSYQQPSFEQPRPSLGNNPFENFAGGLPAAGGPMPPIKEMKTPAGEKDMLEWWK